MERDNIRHQIKFKLLDIFSPFLSTYKLFPCLEQIFERNDIIVCMFKLDPSHINEVTPPPHAFTSSKQGERGLYIVARL
jgi:hypothetical protein